MSLPAPVLEKKLLNLKCFSRPLLQVESRIITTSNSLVTWHLSIWLDAVLEAEELPAGVTDLDTGLTDVDGNDFSHCDVRWRFL